MSTDSRLWPARVPKTVKELIRLLRKAELHLHLEGTNEPEFAFERGLPDSITRKYPTPAALRKLYATFKRLDDFLPHYYNLCAILRRPEDFYGLTWAYILKAHENNVVHVEPFVDTQTHLVAGVAIEDVIIPIQEALRNAFTTYGITSHLIPQVLRHLPPEDAMANFQIVKRFGPLGFGLDSSELEYRPALFGDVFDAVRAEGFLAFAHAGEEGPWEYVDEALDVLQVSGVDHGDNSLQSVQFTRKLAKFRLPGERRMRLTVCPLSRLRLGGINSLTAHRIRQMLEMDLFASLHSDDPAYFLAPDGADGYINNNYIYTAEALDLTGEEVTLLCNNSLLGSFGEPAIMSAHVDYNNSLLAEYNGQLAA
jgi:adenine deaminase